MPARRLAVTLPITLLLLLGNLLAACGANDPSPIPPRVASPNSGAPAPVVAAEPTPTAIGDAQPSPSATTAATATTAASPTQAMTPTAQAVSSPPVAPWGNHEIYVINVDGSGEQRLTHGPQADVRPAWSPDGEWIAWSRHDALQGSSSLHVMRADGSEQRLVNGISGEHIAWSPDSTLLAITTPHGFNDDYPEVYLVPLDGTDPTRLTSHEVVSTGSLYMGSHSPAWSPDGTRIAFVAERLEGGSLIAVIGLDSPTAVMVSDLPGTKGSPVWSPDGAWLAFSTFDGGRSFIAVSRPDGSDQRVLTDGDALDFDPTWSADGRQIAFARQLDAVHQIHVVDVESREVRDVSANDGDESTPRWSPDGAWIAFVRAADRGIFTYDLFVMRPDGSELRPLAVAAHGGGGMEPHWSPDGNRLVFTSTRDGGYPAECNWFVTAALAQVSSIEALAWMSHVVAVGNVEEQLPPAFGALQFEVGAPRAPIYTDYRVTIEQQFRGYPLDSVRIRAAGGTIGACQQTVSPQPELVVGSTLLLFLNEAPSDAELPGAYVIVGGPQGAWHVNHDGRVSNALPHQQTYTGLSVDDLAERIRVALTGAPPRDAWLLVTLEEAPLTP